MTEYIPLFLDFNETTQDLSDEECGRLVRAMVDYANGIECDQRLCGAEKIAFRFVRGTIDRNRAISAARAKAGATKRNQTVTNGNKPEQTESNANKTEQNVTSFITKTKNKTKNKTENKNKDKDETESNGNIPPTVDEVAEYCKERGNGISAEHFIDYYTSRGWVLTNGKKVRDWRACVRLWERNNGKWGAQQVSTARKGTVAAQDYEQRSYAEPRETIDEMLERLERGGA